MGKAQTAISQKSCTFPDFVAECVGALTSNNYTKLRLNPKLDPKAYLRIKMATVHQSTTSTYFPNSNTVVQSFALTKKHSHQKSFMRGCHKRDGASSPFMFMVLLLRAAMQSCRRV